MRAATSGGGLDVPCSCVVSDEVFDRCGEPAQDRRSDEIPGPGPIPPPDEQVRLPQDPEVLADGGLGEFALADDVLCDVRPAPVELLEDPDASRM